MITAFVIGLIAGLIDATPMLIRKMDKASCISAFFHYLILGLIIPYIQWGIPAWITGISVSIMTAIPIMVIVYPKDKTAIIPMTIFSIILGAGIGIAGKIFVA